MPVPAYTWQLKDWPSASRLNGELFRTNGQPFQPNGTGFHAARPVYRGFPTTALFGITPSAFYQLGHNTAINALSWGVAADTAAMFGSRFDPLQAGSIVCNVPNSGGAQGSLGGLGLVSAFVPLASGVGFANAGLGGIGLSVPTSLGTGQVANGSFQSAPWALDIMDLNGSGPLTCYVESNQIAPSISTNTDGSASSVRFQAHWASAYPANGVKIGALPSLTTSYAGNTPLSAALFNQNIQQLMNLLNMPPLLRVKASASTSLPSGALTTINFPAATYDTYGGWSSGRDMFTVPLPGVYLVAGFVQLTMAAAAGNHMSAALTVNGNTYWGPSVSTIAGIQAYGAAKVGIFDLNAGDTIQLAAQQQSGSTQNSGTGSILVLLYLGAQGIGSPTPSLPDPNYSFTAGMPGSSVAGALTSHMANDLNFLLNRPYFLGYQASAQTGDTQGANSPLKIDTVQGLVHGTAGDPWSGWDAANHRWVAPVAGWYLTVEEIFGVPPTQANASCQAAYLLSAPGANSPDVYQIQPAASGVSNTGAAALGYYYLRAGDWIQPQYAALGTFAGGTVGTNVAGGTNSHFEIVWLGE